MVRGGPCERGRESEGARRALSSTLAPRIPRSAALCQYARHKEGAIWDRAHRQGVVTLEEELVRQTKMPPNNKKAITHALGSLRDLNSVYERALMREGICYKK